MSGIAPFLAPERDQARPGYGKSGTSFAFIPGEGLDSISTSGALTAGTDYYAPIFIPSPVVVDQLIAETTAGSANNFRMGLYAADTSWQPIGAPVADSGAIADGTAVKTYTPATPLYLSRGRYLTVLNCAGTPTFRLIRGTQNMILSQSLGASPFQALLRVTRAHAAFPTPGTAWTTASSASTTSYHMVFLRVTAG